MAEIPQSVLSEAFQDVIGDRRIQAAVFLTFQFEPGFFEQEILPVFFNVPLSLVPEIRLLSLADVLRVTGPLAVYYDRAGLVAGSQSARLDVQRIPVSYRTGYFHPKNVLAIVEEPGSDENPAERSLVVAALSANLTRSGWWENVEVAHIEEVPERGATSLRGDLMALIRRVRRCASHVDRQDALDAIAAFVERTSEDQRMRDGTVLPRLFGGESLIDFLVDDVGVRNRLQRCNIEVLSPFFDDNGSLGPLERLAETFRPRQIRVFLPRSIDGDALCSSDYFDRMREVADWGQLPNEVMKLGKNLDRHLHAKVYRFFDPERRYEAFFIGSVNLTTAGFGRGGNMESGFFVEVRSRKPDWWLSVDRRTPVGFIERGESDDLPAGRGWKLSVRYRWSTEQAAAYWDDSAESAPLQLLSNGVLIADLSPLPPRTWCDLDPQVSAALAGVLKSSAFITVRITGEAADAQILVTEDEMTHKPSLMATLSAADILRYWSLLTPEQKKEFLEEHSEAFGDPEVALWLGNRRLPADADSFFSTFAQIYLSFTNLENAVRKAMEEKREREAVDRLFGLKFDSLRRLVDQVLKENDTDIVRRYVTLLCAKQLVRELGSRFPDFFTSRRSDLKLLQSALDNSTLVREELRLGSPDDQTAFLDWFERWFVNRAAPVEMTAQ